MIAQLNSVGMYDCKGTAIKRSHVTPGVAALKGLSTHQHSSTWENTNQILRHAPPLVGSETRMDRKLSCRKPAR